MAKYVTPGVSFEASVYNVGTGLQGILGLAIEDGIGNVVDPRSVLDIVESPAGSGIYSAVRTAPATPGQYILVWDDGSGQYAAEDLSVTTSAVLPELGLGSIADRVRAYIPATYDALLRNTTGMFTAATAGHYSSGDMARVISGTKFRLFGTVVDFAAEATIYNQFVMDYTAKVAVLRIIPAGADFWSDQMISQQAREESEQYPDRIDSLWKIHKRLLEEVLEDKPYFETFYPSFLPRSSKLRPAISTPGELQTTDPEDFGVADVHVRFGHGREDAFFGLPWSEWE